MKRARIGFLTAMVFAVATMAYAQAKPDFSGTWALDPSASQMGAGAGAGAAGTAGGGRQGGGPGMGGGPIVITQTADTLTIEQTRGENKVTTTYKLDGTAAENTMAGRGGQSMVSKYVSKWDGAKLVTTITAEGPNGPTTRSETRYLEGGNMVVEGTRTGRDGNPMTTKMVYKKTT